MDPRGSTYSIVISTFVYYWIREFLHHFKDWAIGSQHHAISFRDGPFYQDGDEILPEADEQFLEVHLSGRYWGPNYERGDWPAIRSVIEWFWIHLPDCEVWYGGDSSGICAVHMTDDVVTDYSYHYYKTGRSNYTRYRQNIAAPPCPICNVPMIDTGGCGTEITFYYCDGCGHKSIQNGNSIKHLKENEDFFNWRDGK